MKQYGVLIIIVFSSLVSLGQSNWLPTENLSFKNAYANADPTGVTWYPEYPLIYGIYRTPGTWLAPNYQQLKLSWDTGIILDPGVEYGKSFVDVQGAGLRVTSGSVGIGTTDPKGYKLAVAGNMIAESVKVKLQNTWPDYVFAKSYQLLTLQQTEKHIKEKGHLPGIPSAKEVEAEGINLGEMNVKLLQKIEELTLHLIEQGKNQKVLQEEVRTLKLELHNSKSKE